VTIRRRLLLWYTGVLFVLGAVLVVTLYLVTRHKLLNSVDHFLKGELAGWRQMCLEEMHDLATLREEMRREVAYETYFPMTFRLADARSGEDIVFIVPEKVRARFPSVLQPPPDGRPVYSRLRLEADRDYRLLTEWFDPEEHPGLVIQAGADIHRLRKRLRDLGMYSAISLAAAILLGLIGGHFLTSRSLRPMDEICGELERIESGDLSRRLYVRQEADEVRRLRSAINRMLERLEAAFARVGGFTADAAHELRTPLATMRCRIEAALARSGDDAILADLLAEVNRMSRTVNDLLLLARMDAQSLAPSDSAVPMSEVLGELREVFAVAAEEKGLRFDMQCGEDCWVAGDRELIRRLFANLIENALRYTPAGGAVNVVARRDGTSCEVKVSDTGIGIPAELHGRIFERFFRAEDSRSRRSGGAGLGLSIARSIVLLHRGEIAVESEPGRGSTFTVRLPSARCQPRTPS